MKVKRKFALIFGILTFSTYGNDELRVDTFYLDYLLNQVRNYNAGSQSCWYENENPKLFNELVSTKNSQATDARYINKEKSELQVFIKIPKTYRPGLSLNIKLMGNQCKSFEIYEVMN